MWRVDVTYSAPENMFCYMRREYFSELGSEMTHEVMVLSYLCRQKPQMDNTDDRLMEMLITGLLGHTKIKKLKHS